MFFSGINLRIEKVKNNNHELNIFIEEYKPFVAKCVAKFTRKFVSYGVDEELSIGLIAFSEAINQFDPSKGNFLSFSQLVIQKRIIDYYRKEKKYENTFSINQFQIKNANDNPEFDITINTSMENYATDNINQYRKLELIELKNELNEWKLTFEELMQVSPKHDKLRKTYQEIAYFVLSSPEITNTLLKKKYLPIAEIEKFTKIPRKKIERGRKYIIALIIILSGDYQFIREFVEWR